MYSGSMSSNRFIRRYIAEPFFLIFALIFSFGLTFSIAVMFTAEIESWVWIVSADSCAETMVLLEVSSNVEIDNMFSKRFNAQIL